MAVGAPERAAAIAWLAPLPPPKMAKLEPVTVSPASGALATRATRSVLMAPATRTRPGAGSVGAVMASDFPDSGAGGRLWRSPADRARRHALRATRHRPAGGRRSAPGCRARRRPGRDPAPTARRDQLGRHTRAASATPWAAPRANCLLARRERRGWRRARDRGTRQTRRWRRPPKRRRSARLARLLPSPRAGPDRRGCRAASAETAPPVSPRSEAGSVRRRRVAASRRVWEGQA